MKIFISYRRAEDKNTLFVISIHKLLAGAFGAENVFYDKRDIHGGNDWRDVLDNALNECTVMLVVIGPTWANLTNPDGTKRLFDPNDVTRWEVETGIKRSEQKKAVVIPVLVQNAGVPNSNDLPDELKSLVDRNVVQLRDSDFDHDMEKLIDDIRLSQGYQEDDISTEYFEPKTIRIEKGIFWMGGSEGEGIPSNETSQDEVLLPAYRIGKYPVTNAQYEEFVRKTNRSVAPEMGWDGQRVPPGLEKLPVTAVTWYDALAYCEWLGGKTGRKYSLPNEAQWEKACCGNEKRIYPWGDEFDPQRCNHGRAQIAPVDAYPAQNGYGCFDFVGNVRQWTCTLWGEKSIAPDPRYAYPKEGRNDLSASRSIRRVVRGGSLKDDIKFMRCSTRSGQAPDYIGPPGAGYSFRVAMSV